MSEVSLHGTIGTFIYSAHLMLVGQHACRSLSFESNRCWITTCMNVYPWFKSYVLAVAAHQNMPYVCFQIFCVFRHKHLTKVSLYKMWNLNIFKFGIIIKFFHTPRWCMCTCSPCRSNRTGAACVNWSRNTGTNICSEYYLLFLYINIVVCMCFTCTLSLHVCFVTRYRPAQIKSLQWRQLAHWLM